MAYQGLDKDVLAGLLGSGNGSTADTASTGIATNTPNIGGLLRQDVFSAFLGNTEPASVSGQPAHAMLSTTSDTSTRVVTSRRNESARKRPETFRREVSSSLDCVLDDLEELVRQAKEMANEIDTMDGANPLQRQLTARRIELRSMTPMGLMDIRQRLQIWSEAKRTGRIMEALMLLA